MALLSYNKRQLCFIIAVHSTGEVRSVFPSGWDKHVMLNKLNQGFIRFRNKKRGPKQEGPADVPTD